eukprot:3901764-Rhodomonas_salina.1
MKTMSTTGPRRPRSSSSSAKSSDADARNGSRSFKDPTWTSEEANATGMVQKTQVCGRTAARVTC